VHDKDHDKDQGEMDGTVEMGLRLAEIAGIEVVQAKKHGAQKKEAAHDKGE